MSSPFLKKYFQENKFFEKQKRNHLLLQLEQILPLNFIFDFFTPDLLNVFILAQKIATLVNKNEISLEIILLSLSLQKDSSLQFFFTICGIDVNMLINEFLNFQFDDQLSLDFQHIKKKIKQIFGADLNFAKQNCNFFFETTTVNFFLNLALTVKKKYKTSIIDRKILFYSLLQEKTNYWFSNFLRKQKKLLLFKSFLVKKIYLEEINFQYFIPKQQRFNAYLTRTILKEQKISQILNYTRTRKITRNFFEKCKIFFQYSNHDFSFLKKNDFIILNNSLRENNLKFFVVEDYFQKQNFFLLKNLFLENSKRIYSNQNKNVIDFFYFKKKNLIELYYSNFLEKYFTLKSYLQQKYKKFVIFYAPIRLNS